MGVHCGGSRGSVFLVRKQVFKFGIFLAPVGFSAVESVCNTAPANIFGKYLLFFGSGSTVFLFNGFQKLYCRNVVCKTCFCAAICAVIFVGDCIIVIFGLWGIDNVLALVYNNIRAKVVC